ncbi:MAG: TonB-dependent receptor [Nevskia sp.]|nr:TonB-dependent receptor [Nevskia sp.]
MNTEVPSGHIHHDKKRPSRRISLSAFLTGVALLSPGLSHATDGAPAGKDVSGAGQYAGATAADPAVVELQAEVAQLKRALEKSQRELAEQQGKAPTAEAASATPAAEAVESKDQSQQAAAEVNQPAQLNQVTVQAPNRLKAVKDVPQSISVISGADLELQDAVDMGGITRRASNVTWNSGNSREFSLSIRGLGYQSNTEAQDPSVGITVDGVAYAYNPLSSFDFTDIDKVEVLRGPQGTLGGKNANVGAINITTKGPSFTPETSFSLAYGQRDSILGTAVLGGPVIDDLLAWRGTLSVDKGDGYIKNLYNPSETYGNRDRVSGRVQFLLTPSENFRARLRFDLEPTGGEFYNGMTIYTPTPTKYANGNTNPLTTDASTRLARGWFTQQSNYTYTDDYLYGAGQNAVDNNSQRPLITRSRGGAGTLEWNLGEYTVTSITAYKEYHFYASNDEGTPFDVTTASGGGVGYHQTSEELRLNSPVGGFVDYQSGIYLLGSGTQGPVSVSKNGWGSDAGAWFANAGQYAALTTDGEGRALLTNSLDGMRKAGYEYDDKKSAALYGQANWHLSDPLTLTTGLRFTYEDRRTRNNALITDNGFGGALNPVAVNNVQLGGFSSDATGALTSSDPAQVALANSVAQQYFGTTTYAGLSNGQRQQVATAKALRLAQIGVLWNTVHAQPFDKVQPSYVISPSYKISPELSTYLSWQHGEKAGISQTTNGVSNLTQPEKSTAYELGVKTLLLHKTLTFNADIFLNNISNYQQAVQVFDAYTTALLNDGTSHFISATGNATKVQAKGVEIDGVYSGIRYTSIRFSGAYNDAKYLDFQNAGQPVENGNLTTTPYRNVSGANLPGAARYTFNLGTEFRYPVLADKEIFASFNTAYTSRYNSDVTGLSSYAWIPGHSITDLSIGAGRIDRRFGFSLLIKNIFDDTAHLATTWNSYTPAPPRWIGFQVTGKL